MNSKLDKRFGQYLVDFANAEDTESAVLSCFENFQQNFSFSPDFYETARNSYPSRKTISVNLNDADIKLLAQILRKNAIIQHLDQQFSSINYTIENYDPISRTVSLMSLEWDRETSGGQPQGTQAGRHGSGVGGFLQTLKLLGLSIVDGPVTIKIDAIRSEIEALLGSQTADRIGQLVEVGHVIEELMIELNNDRYQELQLLAEDHREVIEFHQEIEKIQLDCRQILDMEIEGRPFKEIPVLDGFVDTYNQAGVHRVKIGENNCLLAETPLNECKYLGIKEISGWLDALREDTAYCLIEFLKSEKRRKYLKKCRTCSKYFMARQPHIQKFCTKKCRLNQT